MTAKTEIVIFGAGVRGAIIADFIYWHLSDFYDIKGFYDDGKPEGSLAHFDLPVLGTVERGLLTVPGTSGQAFMALGTYKSWRNCQVWAELSSKGVVFPNLIAPTAKISPSAKLGSGGFFMHGMFVGAFARVGHLFGGNAGSIVEHHTKIGNNVLLGSSVVIAGGAAVSSHCFIGTNSTILPEVSVGCGSLVGAGSTVCKDLPDGVVAIGTPARVLRAAHERDEIPNGETLKSVQNLFQSDSEVVSGG